METKERNRMRQAAIRAGLSDHHTCLIENTIDQYRETQSEKPEINLFTRVLDHPDVNTVMQFFHKYKADENKRPNDTGGVQKRTA